MSPTGVLIRCSCSAGAEPGPMKCSGVLLGGGVALTCGALFLPLLRSPRSRGLLRLVLGSTNSGMRSGSRLCDAFTFDVCASPESGEMDSGTVCRGYEALPCGIWQCPFVFGSIEKILDDWTFGENSGEDNCLSAWSSADDNIVKSLLSLFLLLKIRTAENVPTCNRDVIENVLCGLEKPVRGQHVVVESTPFGSEIFFNSLSRGIISNVFGRQNCLFLTDARVVLGCEGGPVYSAPNYRFKKNGNGHLLGLINAAMVWWRGEYVGLALGVSLLPILRRLMLPLKKLNNSVHISNQLKDRNLLDETIILIRCGEFWGTGLVVDAGSGCVITCSHVLKSHPMSKISAFHNGNRYSVDLIFRTRDDLAYDIAVVKISTPNAFNVEMEMDETSAQVGETVIAAGFPLFNENKDIGLRPTVVYGCIAKTSPIMFQTTCCIQYGASGCAIIRNGKILGLVVSNLKNSDTKTLYPHINFAIPASVFCVHIKNYIKTGSILHLENLESSDPAAQRLWRLEACKL